MIIYDHIMSIGWGGARGQLTCIIQKVINEQSPVRRILLGPGERARGGDACAHGEVALNPLPPEAKGKWIPFNRSTSDAVVNNTLPATNPENPLANWSWNKSIEAVVTNFHHKENLTWLNAVDHVEVGTCDHPDTDWEHCGDRGIGESLPWLEWMASNFDHLPEYVAFLHGPQTSWHSSLSVWKLVNTKPRDVAMLARRW